MSSSTYTSLIISHQNRVQCFLNKYFKNQLVDAAINPRLQNLGEDGLVPRDVMLERPDLPEYDEVPIGGYRIKKSCQISAKRSIGSSSSSAKKSIRKCTRKNKQRGGGILSSWLESSKNKDKDTEFTFNKKDEKYDKIRFMNESLLRLTVQRSGATLELLSKIGRAHV